MHREVLSRADHPGDNVRDAARLVREDAFRQVVQQIGQFLVRAYTRFGANDRAHAV